MKGKRGFLRAIFLVVGLLAVGFLTAFFLSNGSLSRALGDHDESRQGANVISSTDSGAINEEDHSLILPLLGKIGDIFSNIKANAGLTMIGQPWGKIEGLTMFRGSPTRTYYGKGPLPEKPKVLWRYPDTPMCSYSVAAGSSSQWCGNGWTGQPVVWERPDGVTEVIFGAYDGAVHFVDAMTGKETRPKFQTGDLIKGSVTLDPDGYPLLYFGSRDNKLRILSLDEASPRELWALDASVVKGKWNNDWDGNPVVFDDMLFEGGENSWFFAVKLNRDYISDTTQAGGKPKVTVSPKIIFQMPGWNEQLISDIGDEDVSIESSVVFFDNRLYFANSGGRIVGLNISKMDKGLAPVVFDYWTGDDTDATIITDEKGMLYVSSELERNTMRSGELGQFIKLDPYKQNIISSTVADDGAITTQSSGDPFVWGIQVPKDSADKGGIWATPAIFGNYLYVPTHTGRLMTVDKETGNIMNEDWIGIHAWASPSVISTDENGTEMEPRLLVATCYPGSLRVYSLNNPTKPKIISVTSSNRGACIESTPAVWKGRIYTGTREGFFYAFGE